MMDTKYNPVNLLLDTHDYSSWFGKEESTDPAPESDKLKKISLYCNQNVILYQPCHC